MTKEEFIEKYKGKGLYEFNKEQLSEIYDYCISNNKDIKEHFSMLKVFDMFDRKWNPDESRGDYQ